MTARQCPQCGSKAETDSGAGCGCGTPLPYLMDGPTANPSVEDPGLGTQGAPSQAPEGWTELGPETEPATALLPPVAGPTAPQPHQDTEPPANDDTAAFPQEGSGPGAEPAPEAEGEAPATLLHPVGAPMRRPSPEDLVLFADDDPAPPPEAPEEYVEADLAAPVRHRRRKRRMTGPLIAAGAVCAVVLGAVALGSLASSGDDQDQKLPDDSLLRPTAVLPTGDGTLSTTASDASASASPSSSSASADASDSASPSPSESKKKSDASTPAVPLSGPVLSLGQRGSEVTELQDRLRQTGFYKRKADGVYDSDVQNAVARFQRANNISGDPEGVYGPNTRQVLESQTSTP